MSSVVTPSEQKIYLNPYEGNFFDFDNQSSRVYLTRKISSTLKVYGDDCIISGFKIKDIDIENNLVSVVLEKGVCIIDQTIIEYPSDVVMTFDTTHFDDNGFLVLCLSYNFIKTSCSNLSKMKFLHFMNNRNIEFYNTNDRLIFCVVKYNKDHQTVNIENLDKITLNGTEYIIRKKSLMEQELTSFVTNLFH